MIGSGGTGEKKEKEKEKEKKERKKKEKKKKRKKKNPRWTMRKQLTSRDWLVLYDFDDVVTCCVGDTKASRRARACKQVFRKAEGEG